MQLAGRRTGKCFEACLQEIGISKTQAYRFMRAAETGEPVDYDKDTSSRNGTKFTLEELLGFPAGTALRFGELSNLEQRGTEFVLTDTDLPVLDSLLADEPIQFVLF